MNKGKLGSRSVSLGYYLWTLAITQRSLDQYAKAKIQASGVNVLAPSHDHERINVSEFYHPFFFATENVRFSDCELLGPASVVFIEGMSFNGCGFVDCEVVIVRGDRPVKGVAAFRNCTFLRGRFIRITLAMPHNQYSQLPDDMRRAIPVISDGRIGDI